MQVIADGFLASFPLPATGDLVIGRSEKADLHIDHPSISRRHAVLHLGIDRSIEDLGSANGTFIRGVRLARGLRAAVAPSDVVDLGSVMLVLQAGLAAQRPRRTWTHGYFEARVDEECQRAERGGAPFCVARIHVETGSGFEDALFELLGPDALVARYGPADWEMLFASPSGAEPAVQLERLTRALSAKGVRGRLGVASWPRDGRTADALLGAASACVQGARPQEPPLLVLDGAMQRLYRLVERVAPSDIAVLILGETGVGKELVAEALHRQSPRGGGPLVRINCAVLSESMLESELFGHEKGAFTGAVAAKPGLIESAGGGTVLLDEVGELPLPLQAKLLRVLETHQVRRIGALRPRTVDVRFLSATNRNLDAEVARGRFRQDLYFRLNGVTLAVPPLRERCAEILPLAHSFLAARVAPGRPSMHLSSAAEALLSTYQWPGNVRELKNVIERAVLLASGVIEPEHLPLEKMGTAPSTLRADRDASQPLALEPTSAAERQRILDALRASAGNQTKAAELLGMSRGTLLMRLDAYRIPRPRKRPLFSR